MNVKWNNGIGSRSRKSLAAIVAEDGRVFDFVGESIPGVCHSQETDYEKHGRWTNSTFSVDLKSTSTFIAWMQDWDTGYSFPYPTWQEAYQWMLEKAPALKMEHFRTYVLEYFPKSAARWDAAEAAKVEFK